MSGEVREEALEYIRFLREEVEQRGQRVVSSVGE